MQIFAEIIGNNQKTLDMRKYEFFDFFLYINQ